MRHKLCNPKYLLSGAIIVLLIIGLIIGSIQRNIQITVNNSESASLKQASFFGWLFGSKCTLRITSDNKPTNLVELRQKLFKNPAIIIPSADTDVLFCIYDNDVDWQLIRIDPRLKSQPIANNSLLGSIVISSTCKVERVLKTDTNDWNTAVQALQEMSPSIFKKQAFHLMWQAPNQKELIASMRNFGDQGQYPGDIFVPNYMKRVETNR